MRLDIRLPVGLFFSAIGVILATFGLLGPKDIYTRSLGLNVNLAWGGALVLFGGAMIALALGRKRGNEANGSGSESIRTSQEPL